MNLNMESIFNDKDFSLCIHCHNEDRRLYHAFKEYDALK